MADFEDGKRKKKSGQPYLEILKLAVNKILHNEGKNNAIDSLKEDFVKLRKKYPDVLQVQIYKYDALVKKVKEKEFEDEAMFSMYEAGVNAGMV